jgi:ATP-dependent helicase/nuclease subunit A
LARAQGLGRYRRGEIIHRLLQLLPDIAPAERAAAASRLLVRERDLDDGQRGEMAAAALAVLDDDRFAAVFGPGSRAEIALAGAASRLPPGLAISGRVDRLLVEDHRVLVVDFKTNRPAPDSIEAADPAYIRQMAVYWAVLKEIFPGRAVEAALIWTDGPKLMPAPEKLLIRALDEMGAGG